MALGCARRSLARSQRFLRRYRGPSPWPKRPCGTRCTAGPRAGRYLVSRSCPALEQVGNAVTTAELGAPTRHRSRYHHGGGNYPSHHQRRVLTWRSFDQGGSRRHTSRKARVGERALNHREHRAMLARR